MPVLLGDGLRFLDNIDADPIFLEPLSVETVGQRTSLRYRVAC